MAQAAEFTGFGPEAMTFLDGLAADNTKAYFDEHRKIYDTQIAAPMKSLVVAVGERLRDGQTPGLDFEPKVGKSLFRINRDLRFAKDKTPYNTHLDLAWWEGEHVKTSPAFICRITSDAVLTGVGIYGLGGEALDRYRAAIIGSPGDELDVVAAALRQRVKGVALSEASRKRVPKGFDADHSRAGYLLRDGFHMSAQTAAPASITSAKFAGWVVDRLEKFVDLHRWMVTHV